MACTIGLHNDITKRDEISWKHDTKPLYCTCIYIHGTKGDACFVNGRRGGEGEGGRIYAFPSRLDALPFFLVAVGLEQDNMAVIGPLSLTQMCIILGLSFCSPRTHTRTHKPTPEAAQAPEACAPNILLFFFFHSFLFRPLCLLSLLLLLLFFSFFSSATPRLNIHTYYTSITLCLGLFCRPQASNSGKKPLWEKGEKRAAGDAQMYASED